MTTEDLLKLPWDLQVPLASGYVAYVVAFTGLRDRHKTVDVVFISLVFSLIALFVLALATKKNVGPISASLIAFAASVVAGIFWRMIGRPLIWQFLRTLNITWSNDDPSALCTLIDSTRHNVTQIAVYLDDDHCLSCDDASKFSDSPFGPLQIGPKGDIALYVTEVAPTKGKPRPQKRVRDANYGDLMTYIPAERIKRITVRHLPRPLGPAYRLIAGLRARLKNISRASEKEASVVPSQRAREVPSVAP